MTDVTTGTAFPTSSPGAAADAARLRSALAAVRAEVGKAVVGQDGAVTGLMIALLARGHVLLEGVPGVAKTLLVRALSHALSLDTKRVQFTPDLMPGDVTGSLVYDAQTGGFVFREGPVFTNILLADEINRTPPKTQSALLEAMEERQVSVDGVSRQLPDPFIVAATQNPIEYEGTYTLPEAQLDRFLLKLTLDVPERELEVEVLRRHAAGFNPRDLGGAGVTPVLSAAELQAARASAAAVGANADVLAYVVDLARATRRSPSVKLGVSPRGTTALLAAAKAWAWLSGYDSITPDHVQAMLVPVWRHRIQLRPEAELEGVGPDAILRSIVQQVQVPI
ncbi:MULTISPECIES: MoxR family ATPase [unclassified Leifsonia]|jgi:MoxR-like ATPase|uniref:AAA family ATPase n=1 Tax=unclassified Leifsonia TaxID=2663824 RepID=UPI0008A76C88|nr:MULTISPECIES: MoxR family ATPase [unclassified Leifsonia]SEH79790.1 MoxR-like ATPase [Leifsonia sp. CL154]SFL42166.1 MoxR-like ATPase [Leifsonia sp. CL147]